MICQQGRLIAINARRALVEVKSGRGCAACRAGKGCGMAIFSGWFARGPIRLTLAARADWNVGDRIELRISPGALVRLAWTVYGVPLLLLLAGLGSGALVAPLGGVNPDIGAVVGGVFGLAAGLWLLRRHAATSLPLEAVRR